MAAATTGRTGAIAPGLAAVTAEAVREALDVASTGEDVFGDMAATAEDAASPVVSVAAGLRAGVAGQAGQTGQTGAAAETGARASDAAMSRLLTDAAITSRPGVAVELASRAGVVAADQATVPGQTAADSLGAKATESEMFRQVADAKVETRSAVTGQREADGETGAFTGGRQDGEAGRSTGQDGLGGFGNKAATGPATAAASGAGEKTAQAEPARNQGVAAQANSTQNQGVTAQANSTQNQGVAAQANSTQNQGVTAQAEPTQNQGVTAQVEPARNQGVTAQAEPTRNQGVTTQANSTQNQGVAAPANPTQNQGVAAERIGQEGGVVDGWGRVRTDKTTSGTKTAQTTTAAAGLAMADAATGSASGQPAKAVDPQLAARAARQVETGLERAVGQDARQLTLTLSPEELGTVHVTLTVRDKEVRAIISADNADTTALLQDQSDKIRQSLEDQGLKVTKLDVQTSLSQDRQSAWQSPEQHNQAREQREAMERIRSSVRLSREAGGLDADRAGPIPETVSARAAGLDLFA